VNNGRLSSTAKEIYKADESVSFSCNTGYIPNKSETTCLPTKVWSPPPVCNIINCTVPALSNGQYLKLTSNNSKWEKTDEHKFKYGTILNIQCNKWYETTDESSNRTCKEDGTYSPSPPHCVKVLCNDSTDVSHASVDNYPELGVGESGNVSYNSTYFYLTEGSLEVTCTDSRTFKWTSQPHFGTVSYIFAINGYG